MKSNLRRLSTIVKKIYRSNNRRRILASSKAVIAVTMIAAMLGGASSAFAQARILDVHQGLADFDSRTGRVAPTAAQRAMVTSLGARATWNAFGTPQSLIKYGDYLATGLSGDPVTAAREWIRANRTLFRLSDQSVTDLDLLNDSRMAGYDGHAVIFRQRFGNLAAAQDGMITLGIASGKIAYVSSSCAGDQALAGQASLSPTDAWLRAAANIGRSISVGNVSDIHQDNSWTVLTVVGFSHPQRARLVALPIPTNGARPVFETIVLDVQGGAATAYKSFVDAQTGDVLFRQNAVYQLAARPFAPQTFQFQGTYEDLPATPACGPFHDFSVPAGSKSLDVVASAALATNDIVLKLYFGGVVVASSDTATSPEAIHYEPAVLPPGTYRVQVCPFTPNPTVPPNPPYNYAGTFTINDVAGTPAFPYPPKWKAFPGNPMLDYSNTDSRQQWCWESSVHGVPVAGCQFQLKNLAARAPWDHDIRANAPTFTTKGNNANSAEAWGSPLTPGEPYRPVASDRSYIFPFTNQWKTSMASPTVFGSPARNDIDAAIANLFAMHNRMHDFSYFLGFTENNFNSQDNNFGNTAPGPYPSGRESDPQIGDSQAGGVSGGSPSYLGRDNANQIALNDGISPISNMYLWQPIAAAFYPPMVDGDFDMSVIGHEYTHAISNRMVAGPDANLTGAQAGAMGESWSDLNALEYLNAYGLVPTSDENPFSLGAYVTGNKQKGIRNYSIDANPLNYSDVGCDVPGPEVHADGEIWNGVNFELRQVLIDKYNALYPAGNAQLQRDAADGKIPANQAPGNRRWIQIVYDAFLLMQAAPSMLDARDAYLAADMMRFGGANQIEMWTVFAHRGMGVSASSNTTDDGDPKPAFDAPVGPPEANVTFMINDENSMPVEAKVFVGRYEARCTEAADTIASTPLSNNLLMMAGTYEFVFQANGYGMLRMTRTFAAGQNVTLSVTMPTNFASKFKGAVATASSTDTGSDAMNAIDDTENTNWTGNNQLTAPQTLTIDLAGSSPVTIKYVNVSAMLGPGQNRFTALRKFRLETSTDGTNFTPAYTSSDSAFPGAAPRPVAPDLILRTFVLNSPVVATHLRLVALTNQCQGGPAFQGDQDADPSNNSDCTTGSPTNGGLIRVTEVQAFGQCVGTPFVDVTPDNVFGTFICILAQRGVTVGCNPNPPMYCPGQPTTRAEMAVFISRALGQFNPRTPLSQRYADVTPSNFAYAAIEEVASRGIVSTLNCPAGNFCPNAPITREEMAIWIIRALGDFNPSTPAMQRFNDVPSSRPGYAFIEEMFQRGITLGCSTVPPLYCPDDPVTREQMATFLVRAFNL
jgi:extracellular elastinolytic metalloproteinase